MAQRKLRPFIVPIFLPNQGCPFHCIFCDQEKITSQGRDQADGRMVHALLTRAMATQGFSLSERREVAFYGGTFTRLPLGLMHELLEATAPYIKDGIFHSLRISTRPDALEEDRLELLRKYGVAIVELGAQSMDDGVLILAKRGHTSLDTVNAVHRLRQWGFGIGIQLIPGLPGETPETFQSTLEKVIDLRPDFARLYPAVVLAGTGLSRLYGEGVYKPMGLDQAIETCALGCATLEKEGIPVIRIGLVSSPTLHAPHTIIAGPWHPAFGFLVRALIYRKKVESLLPGPGKASGIRFFVYPGDIPLIRGYRNEGISWIESRTGSRVLEIVPDRSLAPDEMRLEIL